MYLNSLRPAKGSKTPGKRLGRGIGSGKGKTCGRGHKGQKARAGGFHKLGFEGGQMPLQRRIPKSGFNSKKSLYREEIRLSDLNAVQSDVIDFLTLQTEGLVRFNTKTVKVIFSEQFNKVVTLKGLAVTAGARAAIVALGGKVE